MPRMVRITATNTSTFYSCDLFDSDTTHRVVRFLLAYTQALGHNLTTLSSSLQAIGTAGFLCHRHGQTYSNG